MKTNYFITFILLLISVAGFSQRKKTKLNNKETFSYASKIPSNETIVNESYHYAISKDEDGYFYERIFYPETKQLTFEGRYLDKKLLKKDGFHKEWLDNGKLISEVKYVKGKRQGEGKTYSYKEGYLTTKIYKDDKAEGKSTSILWGKRKAEYTYVNNKREGEFIEYDSIGIIINKGIYKNDTLFSETIIDTIKKVKPLYQCTSDFDNPKCNERSLLLFLANNLRYPPFAREYGVEGKAICEFTVSKTGKIEKIIIHRGLCDEIKAECIRILGLMPDWEPGSSNGKNVNVYYTLPIMFRLEG